MPGSHRESSRFGYHDEQLPLIEELQERLAIAEVELEQALSESEERRRQAECYIGECLCLESELLATLRRLREAEFALDAMQRKREEERAAFRFLERRLLANEIETVAAVEELHATLEELQAASEELAEANRRLHQLNRDLEAQVVQRTTALEAALADRDALIHEIHHQTRNNLQIISSLLNLQASRLQEPSASEVRRSFRRIQTISLVHGLLFDSDSAADMPIQSLLQTLCDQLTQPQFAPKGEQADRAAGGKIDVQVTGSDGTVTLNTAGPLALMVAELVGNALAHGFPEGGGGRIEIMVQGEPRLERIIVQDNGIGLNQPTGRRGLGLLLVRSLARQLGAQVRFERSHGTLVEITLPR